MMVENLSLAPNPSNGIVNITHPLAKYDASVSIFNPAGVLVKQVNCSKNSTKTVVNVAGIARGNYHVMYSTRERKMTCKLMVL
jgi:hypothetical protein